MSSNNQLGDRVARGVPFSSYEYVDVVFDGADEDTLVQHQLRLENPELVRYEVVSRDRAGDVYHDTSNTHRPWKDGYLFLRCETAGSRVRLRLSVES
jgi:hypothetical protein